MNKYSYCVNTFDKDMVSVQICGVIDAENENDAVQKLIGNGTVYARGYEFLEMKKI